MSYVAFASRHTTALVGAGQTRSAAILAANAPIVGVFLPIGFEGTTLSFEAAPVSALNPATPPADADFLPVHDAKGDLIQATVGPNRFVAFFPGAITGLIWLRLVVASQTLERSIGVVFGE